MAKTPDPASDDLRGRAPATGAWNPLGASPPADLAKTQFDVAACVRGDDEAFRRIWSRFSPALDLFLASRVRSRLERRLRDRLANEKEDLLQEVAAVVHRKLGEFEYRGPGSVLAWMTQITDNVARDWVSHWRADRRHPEVVLGDKSPASGGLTSTSDEGPVAVNRGPGPATEASLADRRERVVTALSALSDRQHTIVLMRFYAAAEWSEIAQEIGAPSPDAVRVECNTKILPKLAGALAGA